MHCFYQYGLLPQLEVSSYSDNGKYALETFPPYQLLSRLAIISGLFKYTIVIRGNIPSLSVASTDVVGFDHIGCMEQNLGPVLVACTAFSQEDRTLFGE